MALLPAAMKDRWENRAEPDKNHGTVYWHILMRDHPQVCDAVTDAQRSLSDFPGLHMTPREWLHITTLVAGSTNEITRNQMTEMVSRARSLLNEILPIRVIFEKIFYHPEAIALGAQPPATLLPILNAVRSATRDVIKLEDVSPNTHSSWTPHVTISYSTAAQPAAPIISCLGTKIPGCAALIDTVTLVIQWGPERHWNWETVGTEYCVGVASRG